MDLKLRVVATHCRRSASVRHRPRACENSKVLGFSGVALPFPRHCEANTAGSGGSIFSSVAFRVRFHTPSTASGRRLPNALCGSQLV